MGGHVLALFDEVMRVHDHKKKIVQCWRVAPNRVGIVLVDIIHTDEHRREVNIAHHTHIWRREWSLGSKRGTQITLVTSSS